MPIGLDVLYYVFSEVNFIKPEVAKAKMDTAFNRLAARFKKVERYFGNIVIDSSAAESGSFVDEFVEERCNPETTVVVRSKIWDVKPHIYGRKGWFEIYLGDSTRDAFIINSDENEESDKTDLDPDRIMRTPKELFTEFRLDLNLSLNDHAGISTTSNDFFIQNRDKLSEAFTAPFKNPEVVELDFFSGDRIYDSLLKSIQDIPKDKVLSVRFDIGIVSDYTGLSICYFDDYIVTDTKNKNRVPKFVNAVTAAIGRISGQETSISKLYQFIKDLSKEYEIGAITCDQFGSAQLLQDLKRDGFNAFKISVDRTDQPYQALKLAIYEGRIQIPQSKLLQRELRELQYNRINGRGKVDHPESTSADTLTYGKGSKDCADALAGAIDAINLDLDLFTGVSKIFTNQKYSDHLKKKTLASKVNIQKDVKKLMQTGGYAKFRKAEMERSKLFDDPEKYRLPTERKSNPLNK